MRFKIYLNVVFVCCLVSLGNQVYGQATNNPSVTVDEAGHGRLLFPSGSSFTTVGVLAPDPGPGGLPAALTYKLLGPPGLVAGDVLLLEPGNPNFSDIIRFNPGNITTGYPASLVFYSDAVDTGELLQLADTGFPTNLYTNTITISEVLQPGNIHQATYTPGTN